MFLHHRPIKTVVTGKSGSGKTTYFERLIANGFKAYWQTVFLYDWQGEMSERLNVQPCFKFDELQNHLENGFVCFDPCIEFENDYETGLLAFAKWSFEICKARDDWPRYPRLFACDEIQLLTDTGSTSPELKSCLQTGRRVGLDLAIVAQQLNELNNKLRSQSTERVCFQHVDPRVLDVLQDWGFDPREVEKLQVGEFLYLNDRGERQRQAMFKRSSVTPQAASPDNPLDNKGATGQSAT